MRDFLTGIAIILIVVLTTLLVAPYFVDWNGQRAFLETQLSRALGQKVTIGGNIDLKLLPTPYLRLNQTVIGSDDGAIRIGIRHLDLELSVAPLLHGEFDIVEGRLDEPTIRVTLQMDRNLPVLPDTPALRANVRLERISVFDGTLAIADPQSGRTFVADRLNFSAEAPSLAGPFKGTGTQGRNESLTKFRFSTTTSSEGKTRIHLALDETQNHPALDLGGDVALSRPAKERLRQSFDGTVAVSGHVYGGGDAPIAWRLSGPLRADPQSATLSDGELRVGDEDHALSLQAAGDGTFGDRSKLHLSLIAQQLDIDRLSGAPVNAVRPLPPKLPPLPALRQLMAAVTPPLPTIVDVNVDTATWGGETISGLVAHFGLGSPATQPIRLSGDGPGGLHLDIQGALAESGDFGGHVDVAAADLPTSMRWLASVSPEMVPTELPFRSMSVASRFTAGASDAALTDLRLGLDGSKLNGSMHVSLGERTKISADLTAAVLDLDALPDLRAIETRALPFDLALVLDTGAVKIAHAGGGRLDAGRVRLDAAVNGHHVTVKEFAAEHLGGASVKASGSADETSASLAMTIDAAHLEQAAALAQQLVPGAATDAFAARAGTLAPTKLKVDANFAADADRARLTPSRIDITGNVADTRLDVHLAPEPNSDGVTLTAKAEAAQLRNLLGQFGVTTMPIDIIGAGRIALAANGRRGRPLTTKIDATFGGTHFAANGSFDLLTTRGEGGSGTVRLESADAAPLLQTLGLVPLDMTNRLPADLTAGLAVGGTGVAVSDLKGSFAGTKIAGAVKWQRASGADPTLTGSLNLDRLTLTSLFAVELGPDRTPVSGATWSNEAYVAGLADPPRAAIVLRAGALDLGLGLRAEDAALDIAVAPNLLTLKHGVARFAGGRLTGDLSLRRDGAQASLAGSLAVDNATLDIAPIKGSLTGKLDFAGGGQSPLALVASLAGTGQAALADTLVGGVNARALPGVFAATEDDTLTVDDESVLRAFEDASAGTIDLGQRRFAASLAGGSLALTGQDPPVAIGLVTATLGGSLDLRRPQLEVHVDETLKALPKSWTGPAPTVTVRQVKDPGAAPKRSFDVSTFVNVIAGRAIARESARIDSYEFDVRERALFNARLEADRRREQDRLKAELDAKAAAETARRVEAERKAKAEAARLEKQRADRDARDRGSRGPSTAPRGDAGQSPADRSDAPASGASADPSAEGRY